MEPIACFIDPESAGAADILVIHAGALGDVILTWPFWEGLIARGHRLHLLAQGRISRLAGNLGLVTRGYALEAPWTAGLFVRPLHSKLRAWLAEYGTILIFARAAELRELDRGLPRTRVICVPPRPPVGRAVHVTAFLGAALREQGLALPSPVLRRGWLDLWAKGDGTQRAQTGIIALHPGSGSNRKNLPLAVWRRTARLIQQQGGTPAWVLGPAEETLAAELAADLPAGQELWDVADLRELCARMLTLSGFWGHDSGLSHLAAYLGVPVLAVFGPSDPLRWRPWGPRVKVWRPLLLCQPCFETKPANCADPKCLADVAAEDMIAAWEHWGQGICKLD